MAGLIKKIKKKRQVNRMDSCDSHGRSCSSRSERWKEQSEMRLFHSVLSVQNICENIMSVYQKDIFDRMYRCHQNLYGIITL